MLTRKFFTATALVTAMAATPVLADSFIGLEEEAQMIGATVEIDTINMDVPGYVVVYDYDTGEFGEILGQMELDAGAHADVVINVGAEPVNDVAVVIYEGAITTPDMAADWIEIELADEDGDDSDNNDG